MALDAVLHRWEVDLEWRATRMHRVEVWCLTQPLREISGAYLPQANVSSQQQKSDAASAPAVALNIKEPPEIFFYPKF